MAKVYRIHELGGPEVLKLEEMEVGDPGPGEARIRVEAVGLNRAEAMYRAGRYPVKPQLPSLIGYEGCGTIEALGPGVEPPEVEVIGLQLVGERDGQPGQQNRGPRGQDPGRPHRADQAAGGEGQEVQPRTVLRVRDAGEPVTGHEQPE